MATYLVTGAAGFIAARVCELLLADGHAVVGVDNLNDYYDVRLKEWRLARLRAHQAFSWQRVDIEEMSALEPVFAARRFDAVVNLAARAGVRASLEQPELYRSTNILGERNVLECQRKFGVPKHVLASSSSLYAGSPMPFSESLPLNAPQSPYAETKKQAELLARDYHARHGLDVTILRYFTVFGPAGRPDMAPFRFIKWIDEGTPITLFGDGTQARDFTYVDDIARGTVLALKPLGCEIINLGGGRNPLSLLTVIGFVEQALGKRAKITGQPPSAADMKETWADIAKAQRLLGWTPAVSAEEGFRRAVAWHLENRDLVRSIKV
ncbi:MAG TPA: NAD-dependent epimerase/dehydratase family protein [Lacunisphaera sp.]